MRRKLTLTPLCPHGNHKRGGAATGRRRWGSSRAAVVTEQTQHSTEHRACAAVDIIKLPDKATQRPRLNRCATLFFPLWQVSSLFT